MGYSRTFLLLGLAFAVVLLIASEVSARELVETQEKLQTDAVKETDHVHHHHEHKHEHEHKHGHHGKPPGHGHHGKPPGHGHPGSEKLEVETESNED